MEPVFVDVRWSSLLVDGVRLLVAAALGGAVGLERQVRREYAGLRTNALVSLGSATFVLLGITVAGADPSAFERSLQGVIVGIGFLGSGTIIKLEKARRVRGLTTAAAVWCAAAIGVAAGTGYVVLALVVTALTLILLTVIRSLERMARLKVRRRLPRRARPGPRA